MLVKPCPLFFRSSLEFVTVSRSVHIQDGQPGPREGRHQCICFTINEQCATEVRLMRVNCNPEPNFAMAHSKRRVGRACGPWRSKCCMGPAAAVFVAVARQWSSASVVKQKLALVAGVVCQQCFGKRMIMTRRATVAPFRGRPTTSLVSRQADSAIVAHYTVQRMLHHKDPVHCGGMVSKFSFICYIHSSTVGHHEETLAPKLAAGIDSQARLGLQTLSKHYVCNVWRSRKAVT